MSPDEPSAPARRLLAIHRVEAPRVDHIATVRLAQSRASARGTHERELQYDGITTTTSATAAHSPVEPSEGGELVPTAAGDSHSPSFAAAL